MSDGHAVLAVAREDVVVVANPVTRANLCGLLANRRSPESELPLALKCGGLVIEAAHAGHIAVEL